MWPSIVRKLRLNSAAISFYSNPAPPPRPHATQPPSGLRRARAPVRCGRFGREPRDFDMRPLHALEDVGDDGHQLVRLERCVR